MTTVTTSYDARTAAPRVSMLRRMVAGAAAFDAVGGVFSIVAASELARWLSVPRGSIYTIGALFLVAAGAGVLAVRREPFTVTWIVAANELFAVWCLVVLATDGPNALGAALLGVAAASSAGTGVAEHLIGRRR